MLAQEHKVRMQIVRDLDRVKWLEKGLDQIAQADDNHINLIDGLSAESHLTSREKVLILHCICAVQAYFFVIVGVALVILREGMIAHKSRQMIHISVRCVQIGSRFRQSCIV